MASDISPQEDASQLVLTLIAWSYAAQLSSGFASSTKDLECCFLHCRGCIGHEHPSGSRLRDWNATLKSTC